MRLTEIEVKPIEVRISTEEILADLLYPAPTQAADGGVGAQGK